MEAELPPQPAHSPPGSELDAVKEEEAGQSSGGSAGEVCGSPH